MTLLERAAQLDLLTTRLGEVQERSRGRFVLVAGEAGGNVVAFGRLAAKGSTWARPIRLSGCAGS